MKTIAVVTSTRAEFGLLFPLLNRIVEDSDLQLNLIVTGMHLSEKYGYTVHEIDEAGFTIDQEIPILEEDNTSYGISLTIANAIKGMAEYFRERRPDILILLGDRTEMLGVAISAMNELVPIAHIHGGEVTEGAVDDCIRHAISKMSYLHFTSTEIYRKRVIQLGEDPDRVFNVGALGAENILTQDLLTREELNDSIEGLPVGKPYAVVTYHPVTLEEGSVVDQIETLLSAMQERVDLFFVITASNADTGGDMVNEIFQNYCRKSKNALFVHNLGMKRYLSAVKHAAFVLGNSSSGILEAPVLGTPTVNIGDRQKGRLMAETVICCKPKRTEIIYAIEKALSMLHRSVNLFGDGHTSEKIVQIMKDFLNNEKINLKKGFYDL